ncbi:type VII secretion integral membrane protein EccD [Mycobacterium camsae]|uniref:type VII secretion integral membrane protein EccD n=1 Tax=Mycobacterium gordonae TaxID=1778 RepID=UPI001F11A3CD|nr:type VII secretion integral membrane protein EccD [Mycobacterium gordonae]
MTGVSELRRVRVVSAAPDHIRVSVFGGRTQLDIALPLDVPVSSFVPEVARLVSSRDTDEETKDERRTFWVLSRVDGDAELRPDQTLRDAGVAGGELLRLSPRQALTPPTLYDDVVDAVGRLNKAAYAAWDSVSARWMAFVGVHLAAVAIVYCLIGRTGVVNFSVIVGVAGAAVLALVGGATMAHRSYRLDDVAAALGWAAIPVTAGITFALLGRYGYFGLAGACGAVMVLCVLYDRVIGTGHWAYLAGALTFGLVGVALVSRGLHARADIVFGTASVVVILGCLSVRRLTLRLGRFETPTVTVETKREDWDFENPFEPTAASDNGHSGTAMPTAEAVWNRAASAAITRSGLLTGLAAAAAVFVTALLRERIVVDWAAFAFALTVAAVLALRGRTFGTWFERGAVALPAIVILVTTCVMAQSGPDPVALAALGVLLAVAVAAAVSGVVTPAGGAPHRLVTFLSYLDYLAVGSLIPLALWVVGVYQRLGF